MSEYTITLKDDGEGAADVRIKVVHGRNLRDLKKVVDSDPDALTDAEIALLKLLEQMADM